MINVWEKKETVLDNPWKCSNLVFIWGYEWTEGLKSVILYTFNYYWDSIPVYFWMCVKILWDFEVLMKLIWCTLEGTRGVWWEQLLALVRKSLWKCEFFLPIHSWSNSEKSRSSNMLQSIKCNIAEAEYWFSLCVIYDNC